MKRTIIIAAASAVLLLAGSASAKPHDRGGSWSGQHGSERSREVHRMLARGENPGHHYGQQRWGHSSGGHRLHDRRDRSGGGHAQRHDRHHHHR